MQGMVSFFNSTKGFGFIKTENAGDHYFHGSDVQGMHTLKTGDQVSFTPVPAKQANKSPRATQVVLVATPQKDGSQKKEAAQVPSRAAPPATRQDDRETCAACGKRMVPRMSFRNSEPYRSFCPFCGAVHKKFTPCFIATAVYGDPLAPQVQALRDFRDRELMPRLWGRAFVRAYYALSPGVAGFLKTRPRWSAPVRWLLDRGVARLQGAGPSGSNPNTTTASTPDACAPVATHTLTLWHGAKARFGAFSLDFIGKGDSGDTLGKGLYFGETQDVGDRFGRRHQYLGHPAFLYEAQITIRPDQMLDLDMFGVANNPRLGRVEYFSMKSELGNEGLWHALVAMDIQAVRYYEPDDKGVIILCVSPQTLTIVRRWARIGEAWVA